MKSPSMDYLEAHKDFEEPFELLGGPIEINLEQTTGGVHVALPDHRELDPIIFGTTKNPRGVGGTPVITGVPVKARENKGSSFTRLGVLSPFGDKNMIMSNGKLNIEAMDITATDAATTEDKVKLSASWEDKAGNTYTVNCCNKLAAHGVEFPTFGGVVTNTILHGFSRVGTPLMPSEFSYFAFWGIGSLSKNGEVIAQPRLIHGMLTEYVRTENYELAFDSEVTPGRRHFHIILPPFMPDMKNMKFKESDFDTGFELPNGKQIPFWHVMYNNLEIEANRK